MKDLILLLDKLSLAGMKSQLSEITNLGNESSTVVIELLKKLLIAEYEYKKSRSLYYRLQLIMAPKNWTTKIAK